MSINKPEYLKDVKPLEKVNVYGWRHTEEAREMINRLMQAIHEIEIDVAVIRSTLLGHGNEIQKKNMPACECEPKAVNKKSEKPID